MGRREVGEDIYIRRTGGTRRKIGIQEMDICDSRNNENDISLIIIKEEISYCFLGLFFNDRTGRREEIYTEDRRERRAVILGSISTT